MVLRSPVSQKARNIILPVVAVAALLTTGCDLTRNYTKIDRSGNMEFQDYRDTLAPRPAEADTAQQVVDSSIPGLQSYVAQPDENTRPMPLVSISVNQTVPLRDALFELAGQAGYDVELDPRISGSVIFTAKDKPFDEVVKRIAEISGLRYKIEGETMRVELDTPFNKTYKIDYLSYIRKNKGSIRSDVSVVSGDGADTGSGFSATSESEANFWGELETNLQQILGVQPSSGNLKTGADPQITAAEPNPAPVDPVVTQNADGTTQVNVTPPAAVLQVNSLPTDPATNAVPADPQKASYAVNKQAGIVSIYAPERQQETVREYLKELRRSVTSQVLIEAKVLEVSLSDEFASGVDWSQMASLLNGRIAITPGSFTIPTLEPAIPNALSIATTTSDVNAVLQAVSRFGTVKALASPRLTVLNNQSAALNVANNQVYFELDIDVTTQDNGPTETTIDSKIKNVPEGVLINVQPSIDLDNQSVSMAVRPTITRITDFVADPSVQFVTAQNNITGVESRVPVVNVQEMDSIVRMSSGQAIIMGGLMQDRANSTQTGVPVLSEIPVLGSVFRNQSDEVNKTELIIFLKATILDGDSGISDADKDLYKKFSDDRRPWKM